MRNFLDFEKPIADLEGKIEELKHLSTSGDINIAEEVGKLQSKVERQLQSIYQKLTPWQTVQVARHPDRPHVKDILAAMISDFMPLAGDRAFGDDAAVIGGLGRFRGRAVMVIGTEKGRDTDERLRHNFGMARPEGYRKAQRLITLANRFGLPVLTFVDTAGAYPGVDAEERGQAEAIARTIEVCLGAEVPIIVTIVGEGGSGGAVALAAGDYVMMLENAVYSVISPEGCASILWRSAANAQEAAEALRMTAKDLLKLGVIDEIVSEPLGGAHRDPAAALTALSDAVAGALATYGDRPAETLKADRRRKFIGLGGRSL
ncbi:MAG: acetyl-CoA carboxylase carboxyltransferase subunit alpha [Pseudomonadota bacterium]|nr:acetyl-CoA carboxylase carboxyltransferase subunit alpha [Pseudomonadota bacterium]MEC8054764.1 acetyl-CoA carboxylase carboxyltransferase subunit alpha [Pseudomonadota bacterium]MEC8062269.1 acetyl-CoA carboxylase carboxyltransferase subunit alpha [Pseudomonadota bacterium]MEC8181393.1 acetyl-CoA carboxylase carboxyltransferase subunit alpha [Pseudomonadota bacterium]MEC8282142.1 acetyl-CoA carboxylase carboxyltransferase subunit alpha [Pseudomonadota bacterium]|tara:strand:- start:89 stop:1042 length:954 start_codon:yes stop_codon:yes gene_type:complete